MLVGWCGERSEEAGAKQVAQWMLDEGWEARVVPYRPTSFTSMR